MRRVITSLGCVTALALVATLAVRATPSAPIVPIVVAKVSYTGLESQIGTTTLYTPKSDGDYQVVVYATASSAPGGNSQLTVTTSWTDDSLSESTPLYCGPGGTGIPWASSITAIHAKGGAPIQFSAAYSAGTSGLTYDLYLTVIRD